MTVNKLQLQTVQGNWKKLARAKQNDSLNMLRYIILNSLLRTEPNQINPRVLEYLKASFGPVTKKTKLANGRRPYDTLEHLLWIESWNFKRNMPSEILGIQLDDQMRLDFLKTVSWANEQTQKESVK